MAFVPGPQKWLVVEAKGLWVTLEGFKDLSRAGRTLIQGVTHSHLVFSRPIQRHPSMCRGKTHQSRGFVPREGGVDVHVDRRQLYH